MDTYVQLLYLHFSCITIIWYILCWSDISFGGRPPIPIAYHRPNNSRNLIIVILEFPRVLSYTMFLKKEIVDGFPEPEGQ
ncbi:hypothetical protein BDV27DRAFT_120255 [Aspergillus caelatus]|uniref:Uncharacterized protein n=1 Tax=Aspergillus caelatus TaxID=61420 RepID=A0A5N7AIX7_9EURO|nr:uncharacterized protein BDV27DRAFT_120255 [Aspergillus caelatus]KAE8369841.1 hypothetical protein BDV27DRAFT_120255 [Aspergillus caelatus]